MRHMRRRDGFIAGMTAALLAAALNVVARFAVGAPTPFDLAENAITRAMPTVVFAFLLDRLQFNAKPILFLVLVLAQIVAGGVLGRLFVSLVVARWRRTHLARHPVQAGLGLAVLGWVLTETIALPVLGEGLFGERSLAGLAAVAVTLAAVWLVYGVALGAQFSPSSGPSSDPVGGAGVDRRRRRLVGGLAGGASVLALGAIGVRLREPNPTPLDPNAASLSLGPTRQSVPYPPREATWSIPGLSPSLTPVSSFYVVTKNLFGDPTITARDWSVLVDGLVERKLRLGYADLTRLPAVEVYQTLECISNPIGGKLISTAWWRGVRLADVLALAGSAHDVVKVVFHAADGYADSLPLAVARQSNVTLAYLMNGQPLPVEHGYPMRLLAPGRYGLKNVKWITRIELVKDDFQGYWQERGWTDLARVHTMSRIDTPGDAATVPAGPLVVAGVAFSGDRGIERVQVTLDAGKSWHDAELEPPLSPITWTRWRFQTTSSPGDLIVSVQATDGSGHVQWPLPQDTVPDGATGTDLHVVHVR